MSKKKKTKKAKEIAKIEAPNLAAVKTDLTVARDNFQAWLKKNKLERNKDYTNDKKFGKEYTVFQTTINELNAQKAELEGETKKSKKAAAASRTKYDYPADCVTEEQKKKYRVAQRNLAKKAAKGESKPKTEKAEKAKKAEEVVAPTADKKSKGKKEEPVAEVAAPPKKKKKSGPKED